MGGGAIGKVWSWTVTKYKQRRIGCSYSEPQTAESNGHTLEPCAYINRESLSQVLARPLCCGWASLGLHSLRTTVGLGCVKNTVQFFQDCVYPPFDLIANGVDTIQMLQQRRDVLICSVFWKVLRQE